MTLPLPETKEGELSFTAYKKILEFCARVDCLLIGPGLGTAKSTCKLVGALISSLNKKMVIDADALNCLAKEHKPLIIRKKAHYAECVLTPHLKEMSRLSGLAIRRIEKNRKEVAKMLAKYYNITIILKGHKSIVADGQRDVFVNNTGNPGMATAGSGDVLSGMIAAFFGLGLTAFAAAKYAVYLHGLAGDLAADDKTQTGMIASDIIDNIPRAIKICK